MTAPAEKTIDDLTLGRDIAFEELVDRAALVEMAESFAALFGVPLRIFSEAGVLLADAGERQPLYEYLNGVRGARQALEGVVARVKAARPAVDAQHTERCATGAVYQVTGIGYDGRPIGRVVLGPVLPDSVSSPPAGLLDLDPELDAGRIRQLFDAMPRMSEAELDRLADHLRRTLDLILFSGHKALVTSKMHLATVRESYREAQAKNEQLQQAYDRLKELDRLKSNFLATVSHELRTPLTSIIGYSEMLYEGIAGNMSEEQRDYVRTIREKGEQLLELIKGLLDLSKLESGTMSITRRDVKLERLVGDVVQTLGPSARKKGIELVVSLEPALPKLWADSDRLRQILLNLGENAIKFTPLGGRVTFAAASSVLQMDEDGSADMGGAVLLPNRRLAVELRVSDTGVGIPEPERERVFDAFYQVDSSSTREAGGTGLGLSIVKRLVDAHDGLVRVEANQPSGAVFVVTLPCRRATLA